MLKHGYTIREVVSQESILYKHTAEWKRFHHAVCRGGRNRDYIASQSICIHRSLVHLDDHAVPIKKERSGKCQVPSTVEQVAIDQVIDPRDFFGGKQCLNAEPLLSNEYSRSLQIVG